MRKRLAIVLILILCAASVHGATRGRARSARPAPKTAVRSSAAAPKPASSAAAQEAYQHGRALLTEGKAAEAAAELKKAIDSGAAPALAYLCMAEAQRRLGNASEAATNTEAFLDKANPSDPVEAAAACGILGPRVHAQDRYQNRQALFRNAKRYLLFSPDPSKDQETLREFVNNAYNERISDGIELLKKLIEREPQKPEYYELLCNLYMRSAGANEEATRFLEKAVAQFPNNLNLNMYLGSFYHQAKQYPKAMAAYQKALKLGGSINPEMADVYNHLGRSNEAVGMLQKAYEGRKDYYSRTSAGGALMSLCSDAGRLEAFRQFLAKQLEADPKDAASLALMTSVLRKQGKTQEYQAAAKELLDSVQDLDRLENMANTMGYGEDAQLALAIYAKLLPLRPDRDYQWQMINICERLSNQGKPKEAQEAMLKIAAMPEIRTDRLSQMIENLRNRQMGEQASRLLEAALEAHPDDASLLQMKAQILSDQGKINEAIKIIKPLAFGGKGQWAHGRLYQIAEKANRLSELVPDYEAAIARDPSNQELHKALGRVRLALKDYPAALAELKKAQELNPGDQEGLRYLASAYDAAGQPAEAIKIWVPILESANQSWSRQEPANQLVDLYPKAGKADEGIAVFKKLVAANPDDAALAIALVKLYRSAKRVDEALALWPTAIAKAQDWQRRDAMREFVQACKDSGKTEQGISALRKYADANPNDTSMALGLADLYLAAGMKDEAARQYALAASDLNQTWEITNRLLWEQREYELALSVFAAVRLKDASQARQLMDRVGEVMDRINNDDNLRPRRAAIAEKAKLFFSNVQAKFSGTDTAGKATQMAIHCAIPSRIRPKAGRAVAADEGMRVIAELQEVQRLYPDSDAAKDSAFDMMTVYGMLDKQAERKAVEDKIIAGQFGQDAARLALQNRGQSQRSSGHYQEAVADLSKALEMTGSDQGHSWYRMQIKLELAKAHLALGQDEEARKLAQEVVEAAGSDNYMADQARRLLTGGLSVRFSPQHDRTYLVTGNSLTPESTAVMTEKVHLSIVFRGFKTDPVPTTLRMVVPDIEGMTAFPADGTEVVENGKRMMEWKAPMVPSRENEWVSHWYGFKHDVPDSPIPIKGLRISRTCSQQSPGVWVVKLSVSADEPVTVQLHQTANMPFQEDGIEANHRPNQVQPDYLYWSNLGDSVKLQATIRMAGNPPTANYMPEVSISRSSYTGISMRAGTADSREDRKAFSFKGDPVEFSLVAGKEFALESQSGQSKLVTVQMVEVVK